jgi:hypothetical protein
MCIWPTGKSNQCIYIFSKHLGYDSTIVEPKISHSKSGPSFYKVLVNIIQCIRKEIQKKNMLLFSLLQIITSSDKKFKISRFKNRMSSTGSIISINNKHFMNYSNHVAIIVQSPFVQCPHAAKYSSPIDACVPLEDAMGKQ